MKPHYRILRLNHGRAPTVQHATLKEAETEALRLAGQHPGETFEILKCLGIARTTEPAVFWNDGVEPPAPSGLPTQFEPEIDPGEGYRFLKAGEIIAAGDEYKMESGGSWIPVATGAVGGALWPFNVGRFRRKLPEPALAPETRYPTTPLPEGFDRWECRGTGWSGSERSWYTTGWLGTHPNWDAGASLGPTNRVLDLEYWEAVKDEPAYRMLVPGEVIEEGDECRCRPFGEHDAPRETFPWKPVNPAAVGERLVASNAGHYRRPLNKKQAP